MASAGNVLGAAAAPAAGAGGAFGVQGRVAVGLGAGGPGSQSADLHTKEAPGAPPKNKRDKMNPESWKCALDSAPSALLSRPLHARFLYSPANPGGLGRTPAGVCAATCATGAAASAASSSRRAHCGAALQATRIISAASPAALARNRRLRAQHPAHAQHCVSIAMYRSSVAALLQPWPRQPCCAKGGPKLPHTARTVKVCVATTQRCGL